MLVHPKVQEQVLNAVLNDTLAVFALEPARVRMAEALGEDRRQMLLRCIKTAQEERIRSEREGLGHANAEMEPLATVAETASDHNRQQVENILNASGLCSGASANAGLATARLRNLRKPSLRKRAWRSIQARLAQTGRAFSMGRVVAKGVMGIGLYWLGARDMGTAWMNGFSGDAEAALRKRAQRVMENALAAGDAKSVSRAFCDLCLNGGAWWVAAGERLSRHPAFDLGARCCFFEDEGHWLGTETPVSVWLSPMEAVAMAAAETGGSTEFEVLRAFADWMIAQSEGRVLRAEFFAQSLLAEGAGDAAGEWATRGERTAEGRSPETGASAQGVSPRARARRL